MKERLSRGTMTCHRCRVLLYCCCPARQLLQGLDFCAQGNSCCYAQHEIDHGIVFTRSIHRDANEAAIVIDLTTRRFAGKFPDLLFSSAGFYARQAHRNWGVSEMLRPMLALVAVALLLSMSSALRAESVGLAASALSNVSGHGAPARNATIFGKGTLTLACVQPPTACSSNSDCSCSRCCASWSGRGICQPSC